MRMVVSCLFPLFTLVFVRLLGLTHFSPVEGNESFIAVAHHPPRYASKVARPPCKLVPRSSDGATVIPVRITGLYHYCGLKCSSGIDNQCFRDTNAPPSDETC